MYDLEACRAWEREETGSVHAGIPSYIHGPGIRIWCYGAGMGAGSARGRRSRNNCKALLVDKGQYAVYRNLPMQGFAARSVNPRWVRVEKAAWGVRIWWLDSEEDVPLLSITTTLQPSAFGNLGG